MELIFLGITIDSESKLVALRREVTDMAGRQRVRLRELQSLLGKLNFVCRIIPMGQIFCRLLSLAMAGVSAPRHYVRLTQNLRADLRVWDDFLAAYNGRSVWMSGPVSNADLSLFMDAQGRLVLGLSFGVSGAQGGGLRHGVRQVG